MTGWEPKDTAPSSGSFLARITETYWDVGEDCCSPRSTYSPFIAMVRRDKYGELWIEESFNLGVQVLKFSHWLPIPAHPAP